MNKAESLKTVAAYPRPAHQRGRVGIKSTIVVLLIIAGLAGLAWTLSHREADAQMGPGMGGPGMGGRRGGPATTVGIAKAETQSIPVVLEALGTVTPAATVTVRPQVSGVITEVRFKEGQMVTKGQILAVIDKRPFQMTLLQAQGQLQRDQADLQNAQLQLDRFQTLQGQDSIADQEVDTQAATVKQLKGTVESGRAAVGTAQLNLDYAEIKTPVSGRVGLRVIDAGNYIGAGDAAGIAVVTQLSPTDVEFTVPQDRVTEIQGRVAQKAVLPVVAMDRTRLLTLGEGTFSTLDNVVSTDTGTVRAKARFENADGALFPSQFVNVRLTLNTIEDAVVVPVAAVRNGSEGDFVWLLKEDRSVSERKVKRGAAFGSSVQIVEGLKLGDTVITEGGDRLKEDAKVSLPGDKPAPVKPDGERKSDEKSERRKRRPQGGGGGSDPH